MSGSSNWTDIPNGDIDQDSPATETLFTAIRDNIIAQSWSYYDDGDGVIYNSAVDGTVASVESPDFEDGYEYLFLFNDMTATLDNIRVDVYWDLDAAWSDGGGGALYYNQIEGDGGVSSRSSGSYPIYFPVPRVLSGVLLFDNANYVASSATAASNSASKAEKVRFVSSETFVGDGNWTGGKIIMLRRHVNV